MKNKIVGMIVCMLLIATALPIVSAMNVQTAWYMKKNNSSDPYPSHPAFSPGRVAIEIVAKVTEVYDSDNILGGAIHVDDTITGKYIYNSEASDIEPNGQIGYYEFTSIRCGIEIMAGGFVFKTDPSNVEFVICVYNDFDYYGPAFDAYTLWSDENKPLSNGMLVTVIYWELSDATATALSSPDLPVTAPILTDWGSGMGLIIQGEDPSDPDKHYTISAHVTEATKNNAVDDYGVESDLKTPSVTMPYSYNIPFMQFWIKLFEQFPHAFPILRQILNIKI